MKAKRLRPKPICAPPPKQCSAIIVALPSWSDWYIRRRKEQCERRGWNPDRCTRGATVSVNGKPYCASHAGEIALAYLLNEQALLDRKAKK